MSATNRGIERKAYDFYATPINVVEKILNSYELPQGNILEPSAGNGNIIKAIKSKYPKSNVTALEIRREEFNNLNEIADNVIIEDFFNWNPISEDYKVIIGNPPYSLAKEFVEKCLNIAGEDGVVIMLLRTAFLESKSRYEFWQNNPLSELHVLSQRPSFTGKGTDATSYGWFIWDKQSNKQKISVI